MTIHEQTKSLDMHSNQEASKDMQEVPQTCCAGPLWMWTHRNPDFRLTVFISDAGIPSSSFNTTFPSGLPNWWPRWASSAYRGTFWEDKRRACVGKHKHMAALITIYGCKHL